MKESRKIKSPLILFLAVICILADVGVRFFYIESISVFRKSSARRIRTVIDENQVVSRALDKFKEWKTSHPHEDIITGAKLIYEEYRIATLSISARFRYALGVFDESKAVKDALLWLNAQFNISNLKQHEFGENLEEKIDSFASALFKIKGAEEFEHLQFVVYDLLRLPNFTISLDSIANNLWYNFLPQDKKNIMLERISSLKNIVVYTYTHNRQLKANSLYRYLVKAVKQTLPGINNDDIVMILVGSYLFSPTPSDVDIDIIIKNSSLLDGSYIDMRLDGYNVTGIYFPPKIKVLEEQVEVSLMGEKGRFVSGKFFNVTLDLSGIYIMNQLPTPVHTPIERFLTAQELIDSAYLKLWELKGKAKGLRKALHRLMEANLVLALDWPDLKRGDIARKLYDVYSRYVNREISNSDVEPIIETQMKDIEEISKVLEGRLNLDNVFYLNTYLPAIELYIESAEEWKRARDAYGVYINLSSAYLLIHRINPSLGAKEEAKRLSGLLCSSYSESQIEEELTKIKKLVAKIRNGG